LPAEARGAEDRSSRTFSSLSAKGTTFTSWFQWPRRIEHDPREFTLHVRYEEDFAVTADVASKISAVGLGRRRPSSIPSDSGRFPYSGNIERILL
jgi:hypothetical protein